MIAAGHCDSKKHKGGYATLAPQVKSLTGVNGPQGATVVSKATTTHANG
jgi:hypothetical protein